MATSYHGKAIALAIGNEGVLPTEFRLFVAGWNETEKGQFLFDQKAAKQVMAAYREWGVDLAIDLEHQMLDSAGVDPTARDARGWCKLAVRPDGSLWAVDVKWTPDGAERLSQKRQRYISPAFEMDPKSKRVTKVLNVAITAMPATHDTPALVAASASGDKGMDSSLIKQALDAIEKGDAKSALDILKSLIASAAGADPEDAGDDAGAEGDGAEGAPPMPQAESAAPPAADSADDGSDDEKDPSKKAEQKAMRAMLCHLTSAKTFGEALAQVEVFRASHLTLETERQKLAAERATLESAERRSLCVELVTLGAEFPSTVWADDKAKTPKARWQKMPLEELRAHVADQRAARRGSKPAAKQIAPAQLNAAPEAASLTAEELRICEQTKCDPKVYAALKATRDGAKGV